MTIQPSFVCPCDNYDKDRTTIVTFHNPSLKHNPNASNGQIQLQRSKYFYSKIFSSSILKLEIQVVLLNTWKIESSSKRYANYPASAQSTHQSLDYDFIDSFLCFGVYSRKGIDQTQHLGSLRSSPTFLPPCNLYSRTKRLEFNFMKSKNLQQIRAVLESIEYCSEPIGSAYRGQHYLYVADTDFLSTPSLILPRKVS